MADPAAKQVRDALVTLLEGVTFQGLAGITSPTVVTQPAFHDGVLDASLNSGSVICLSPDVSEDSMAAMGRIRVEQPIELAVAARFTGAGEDNPFDPPTPDRWTVQDELERGVKDKLRGDRLLGGLLVDMVIPDTDKSAENTFLPGWAAVIMTVFVVFDHDHGTA